MCIVWMDGICTVLLFAGGVSLPSAASAVLAVIRQCTVPGDY